MKLADRYLFTFNCIPLFAILKINACLFSSVRCTDEYVPNASDLKGTKKKRGKGNKNKGMTGEGGPEKKKHKIEELKVHLRLGV